jgi:hypothetical protein
MLSLHQDLRNANFARRVMLHLAVLALHSRSWGGSPGAGSGMSGLLLRMLALSSYSRQARACAQPDPHALLNLPILPRRSPAVQTLVLSKLASRLTAGQSRSTRVVACLTRLPGARKAAKRLAREARAALLQPAQKALDFTVSDTLVRLLEHELGTRVNFTLLRSPYSLISAAEVVSLLLLRGRINYWLQHAKGSPTWRYIATLIFTVFKTKDISLLTSWLHGRMIRMPLFSHNRFLSFVCYFFKLAYFLYGTAFGVQGVHVRVAGKISVTGNSRKRTLIFRVGKTGANNLQIKASSDFYLVRTGTGCLGLTASLFFKS